jgi:transcriptional regulator with XRE-family HTH domain
VATTIKGHRTIEKELAQWRTALFKTLKAMRNDADLTQKGLAELLGKTKSQVTNLERGHSAIRVTELFRVALVCGVSPAEAMALMVRYFNNTPRVSSDR